MARVPLLIASVLELEFVVDCHALSSFYLHIIVVTFMRLCFSTISQSE